MKRIFAVVAALLAFRGSAQAQVLDLDIRNTLSGFSEQDAKDLVLYLTDPSFQGRGSKDHHFDFVARNMAQRFRRLGYRPLTNSFELSFTAKDENSRYVLASSGWGFKDEEPAFTSKNVIGYLPGRTREVVLVSAHLDHIGYYYVHGGQGQTVFFPGADDNASGVAAVMQIARAFADLAKRGQLERGVVIALWGGEELGLLGSKDFVKSLKAPNNPYPFSLDDVVFVMNLDMVGRRFEDDEVADGGRKSVLAIGSPKTKTFDDLLEKSPVVANTFLRALGMYDLRLIAKYDDGGKNFFARTDSYSFSSAKPELATLFFSGPEHQNYHRATDTAEKLDYGRLIRIAKIGFVVTAVINQSPTRPVCQDCEVKGR